MAVTLVPLGLDGGAQNLTGLALDQDGDFLYGCTGIGEIYKWDITDNSITTGRTTWTTVATLLGGIACDTSGNIYVLSEAQYVRKSALSSPSFSILSTANTGAGDVWQSMTFGNGKLYVGGHRNNGANHILRVWEIDTTTGTQTVITEMDVTTPINASNSYTDVYVASDGAIWAPKPFDKIYRGEPGGSGPTDVSSATSVPFFKGDLLPSVSGGNVLFFYSGGGDDAEIIDTAGVESPITLNLSITKPNISSAVTDTISVKRVIGATDGNGATLTAWIVVETEPSMFSLSRASARHSLLTYACTYGDASTAFHYGDELFPDPEVVFSAPHPYTFNWSTQLGGSNRIMTVYSDGTSTTWAQVLSVSTTGAIEYGEPVEISSDTHSYMPDEGEITEAALTSINAQIGQLAYVDSLGNLAFLTLKTTTATSLEILAVRKSTSSIAANRLTATQIGDTTLVAFTGDIDSGDYPVFVVPVITNTGYAGTPPNTLTTIGDPVEVGEDESAYAYAPHITSMGSTRFMVRMSGGPTSSTFRHGIYVGGSISLSPQAYTFPFDSQDFWLLGVSTTRAINGSLEAGELQVRVIDINTTNNNVTTDTPFHTETDDTPFTEVALGSRATRSTMLIAWFLAEGIRVCHIEFPMSGGMVVSSDEKRLFLRNLK